MSLAVGPEPRTPSGFDRLPGVTPPSSREHRPGFLTDTIISLGLVDSEHVEAAINESRVRGIAPESLLAQQGDLSPEALARARAEHAGLDYVDLNEFDRDTDRDALIGREAAVRFTALPIAVEGRALVAALSDPIDAPAVAEIAAAHKLELIPVVAAADAIEARIEELPARELTPEAEPLSEPVRLQPIEGGATPRTQPISSELADRIVERVDAAIDEVARSEILKALDDATAEIERLSAELEQAQQRATALARERDELRAVARRSSGPAQD
jgi:hypothetical protein